MTVQPKITMTKQQTLAEEISAFGEVPADFIPVSTIHPLEVRAWLMPNGARFVHLVDQSDETWHKYADEITRLNAIQLEKTRNGKTYV